MKPVTKRFGVVLQEFFERHLVIERNASRNTVIAYRDGIKLFLAHASKVLKRSPDELDYAALDAQIVLSFLRSLKEDRGSGPRTRNHRLAALKTLARYVAMVAPEQLERCRKIRDLRPARFEHREVGYLAEEEVVQLLNACASVPRDRALFLLLYNTGARVQEVVDLNVADFNDEALPFVRILGKGRKQRTCPLWTRTVEALRAWLAERESPRRDEPLFLNGRGYRISRAGIAFLLRKSARAANLTPRSSTRLSPHILRHTTAMHLLKSGVDITTIAAWLGHAQLNTTHGYVVIDTRMKQKAIAAANTLPELRRGRYPTRGLVGWLNSLGGGRRYAKRMAELPRKESANST